MKVKLLLAEPDQARRDEAVRALARVGCRVVGTGDGEEAWRRLEAEAFDLLVCPVTLPGRSGLTLLRRLRERGEETDVVLLAEPGLVSVGPGALRQPYVRQGRPVAVLIRPFPQARLVRVVALIVAARALTGVSFYRRQWRSRPGLRRPRPADRRGTVW